MPGKTTEKKAKGRSPEQAIAIGLSKARRAGIPLKPPKKGQAKKRTRRSARRVTRLARESGSRGRHLESAARRLAAP